jgi:hypothetical protein
VKDYGRTRKRLTYDPEFGYRGLNPRRGGAYVIRWADGEFSQSFTKKAAALSYLRRMGGAGTVEYWEPGSAAEHMRNPSLAEELEERDRQRRQGDWYPASAGAEEPFTTRTGRRLQYVYQPSTGRHAYYDLGSDLILDDEEARAALALNPYGYGYGAHNPSELVVLGANPHGRFRVNPSENICGAMIGGYPCTRKPGHRGPHLPQGAPLRPRSRLQRNWKPRRNPSAEALREEFTGAPAEGYTIHDAPGMPAGEYAQLGELLSLYVKPAIGGQVREIRFKEPRPTLISDSTGRQLYFLEGDQDITPGLHLFIEEMPAGPGELELGEVRRIDYKQRKEHVKDPDVDEWKHNFGEESGERPTLWYDPTRRQLSLKGGAYSVKKEGLIN